MAIAAWSRFAHKAEDCDLPPVQPGLPETAALLGEGWVCPGCGRRWRLQIVDPQLGDDLEAVVEA